MTGALDTSRATDVGALAGVLFHVHPLDRDHVLLAVDLDGDLAVDAQRLVVLGDLVVLGHVGIEVVLARESAPAGDIAAQAEPDPDRRFARLLVDHRQRAGQPQADRTGVGVRLAAELGRAAAPHLGRGAEFDVHFEAEHHIEALQRLVVVHQLIAGVHTHRASSW
ncbi:hypothetical protein SDC9_178024 [bioreactor metagenome]|uniref:Uncharacterized protein n=1 Tax=bioreactor metagenome TaxID=1076179 RepID=A0A645H3Z8_9ZZZZ